MMQRLLMTRRNMLFSLACIVLTTMLTIWGCGGSSSTGSGSYTDPNTLISTTKSATIIDAKTLKTWINEGKLNATYGSKDRVVVVSASTDADWLAKGHIPGAVRWDPTKLSENGRTEGLSTNFAMVPSGAMMDAIIKELGIDGNTTIVISLPKNTANFYNQTLPYWNLRYWGFPKERLKILNGGDDAWEVAGYELSKTATDKYLPSTYSVANNAGIKPAVRSNIGQVISTIDSMSASAAAKNEWQIIDVRGFYIPGSTNQLYLKNAVRMSSYTQFFDRLDNKDGVTRNFIFPTKEQLEGYLATRKVYVEGDVDGKPTGTLSLTKKTISTCTGSLTASPTFVLFDAVLNVPEGQIAMYDGSSSQWNWYSTARLTTAYPTATAAQKNAWAFDDPANPRAVGTLPAPTATVSTSFAFNASTLMFGPAQPGMSDQIDKGNQAYIEFIKTNNSSSSQNTGTGGSQQGC